jgi:hypothetical protein
MEKQFETLSLQSSSSEAKDSLGNVTCAICISLIVEPVVTECKHLFCYICLEELMEMTSNEVELKCPMCRKNFNNKFKLKIDIEIQDKIKKAHPKEYESRQKVITEYRKKTKDVFKLRLLYGNTHKLVENPKKSRTADNTTNKHKWCMFVKTCDYDTSKLVRKVVYGLHPTFGATEIEVKEAPFELSRVGWGSFEIPIKIYFQSWMKLKPLELTHELSFNGEGETKVQIVQLDGALIEKNKNQMVNSK